jgi:hypothetical protein
MLQSAKSGTKSFRFGYRLWRQLEDYRFSLERIDNVHTNYYARIISARKATRQERIDYEN